MKILPKPEEVPKKPNKQSSRSLGAWRPPELWFFWYLLRFWQGFQEKYCQKKTKVPEVFGLEVSRILVFFGTSSGFGKVFKKNIARKKPKFQRCSAWRSQEFWFFWYLLRLWQGFQEKYCQKKTKVPEVFGLEVSRILVFLVPPQALARFSRKILQEKNQSSRGVRLGGLKNFVFFGISSGFGKVFKKKYCQKKTKVPEVFGLEVSRILVFLVPPQVLARFSRKILPEKNQSSRGVRLGGLKNFGFFWYLLRFWQGFQEKYCQKKTKVPEVLGLEVSRILVFLVPPQVLARFSRKVLPEKNQSSRGVRLGGLKNFVFFWYLLRLWQGFQEKYCQKKTKVPEVFGLQVSRILVFFGTSSGFGKVFKKNIARKKPKFQRCSAWRSQEFCFFCTSSGFGKVFKKNIARKKPKFQRCSACRSQ